MKNNPDHNKIQDILSFYKCPCAVSRSVIAGQFTDFYLIPESGTTINKLKARVNDFSFSFGCSVSVELDNYNIVLRIANNQRIFYDFFSYLNNLERIAGNIALGITPAGAFVSDNLFNMPHLLVAGSSGSGKSVFIHNAIISLATCGGIAFRLIDLKRVELSIYNGCPFMVSDCITDATSAAAVLEEETKEMQNRYRNMEKYSVNHYTLLPDSEKPLARVIVIDELADLMLNRETRKSVENSVVRIAQLGRAAGVHLILATQRPDTTVVTGLIKANIPARIAFKTSSSIDSRVIGLKGAENLTGKGDCIYAATGKEPQRMQSLYFQSFAPLDFAKKVKEQTQTQPQTETQTETENYIDFSNYHPPRGLITKTKRHSKHKRLFG